MSNHMNEMDKFLAIVSQRSKLIKKDALDGADFDTLMLRALTRDYDLSEERYDNLRAQISAAVEISENKVTGARRNGRAMMAERICAMTRQQKLDEIKSAFAKLTEMNDERRGSELALPAETVEMLNAITEQELGEALEEFEDAKLTEALMACCEQLALYAVSDHILKEGRSAGEQNAPFLFRVENDEQERQLRELAVAAAVNLSLNDRLPEELSEADLQTLSDYVCFGLAIGNICDNAATGHMDFATFLDVASSLMLGFASLLCGTMLLLVGGRLSFILFTAVSALEMYDGFSTLYEALFPAGLSETRAGVAVGDALNTVGDFIGNLILTIIRAITNIVKKVYSSVKAFLSKLDQETDEYETDEEEDADGWRHYVSHDDTEPQNT